MTTATLSLTELTAAATKAAKVSAAASDARRAAWLNAVADALDANAAELVEIADSETSLGAARLTGEVARTTGQLRLFAGVITEGTYLEAIIDHADPDSTPPKPDLRRILRPIGPVAVFSASNFPFAFSVAGGDTASALAVGCSVIVKAHSGHLRLSERTAEIVAEALRGAGAPDGLFALVSGREVGTALVQDPAIKAVGFTGSRSGGMALVHAAAGRREPIPVYAEMSSINPVFVFEGALENDAEALGSAYVTSVTGSSGQLCTAPGLLFAPTGEAGDRFAAAVGQAVTAAAGQTMLTKGIAASWQDGVTALAGQPGVELLAAGSAGDTQNAPAPSIFSTDVATFLANEALQAEIFGAASLVIRYNSVSELVGAVQAMEGQLTATLHLADADYSAARTLLPVLERRVGRILVNGWPTGVEVGHAMVHGGPFPATSDSRTTSVGTLAIDRFLRPVAYQNIPAALLPTALQQENPWKLNRLVDGTMEPAGGNA